MTPEEFAAAMRDIIDANPRDTEALHIAVDDLWARTLCELGYDEGIALLHGLRLWYA